jgi:hypothetical protein
MTLYKSKIKTIRKILLLLNLSFIRSRDIFYSLSLFLNTILVGRFKLYFIANNRNNVMITIQKTMEI